MKLIKMSATAWAVFDERTNEIIMEGVTPSEIVEFILESQRVSMITKIEATGSQMSWVEAQFLAGRLKCCDCSKVLDAYNEKWPLEKQRCRACLS